VGLEAPAEEEAKNAGEPRYVRLPSVVWPKMVAPVVEVAVQPSEESLAAMAQ